MRSRVVASLIALLLFSTVAPALAFAAKGTPPRARPRPPRYEEMLRSRGYSPREIEETTRRLRESLGLELAPSATDRLKPSVRERLITPSPLEGLRLEPEDPARADRAKQEYQVWVQESLNQSLHAGLQVDGVMGPQTRDAIRRFQEARGLEADGVVRPQTERALTAATGTSPPRYFSSRRIGPRRSRLSVRLPSESRDPVLLDDALYIDVQKENGGARVLAWLGALRDAPAERVDPAWLDAVRLDSPDQLLAFLSGHRTLVSRGEALPPQWEDWVRSAGVEHVRVSQRSPKMTLGEHAAAAEALDRTFDGDKTRIFSALPRARGEEELLAELEVLGLRRDEAEGWRRLEGQVRELEAETGQSLEPATKETFLEELRNGDADYIVLFAHSQYGNIRLPDGKLITPEELAAIRRDEAPDRTIVLISCGTGTVNEGTSSIAEILLENKTAINVIAPPEPVSATEIPDMLRRFVAGGETLNQVFNGVGYQAISRRPDDGLPQTRKVES